MTESTHTIVCNLISTRALNWINSHKNDIIFLYITDKLSMTIDIVTKKFASDYR